MMYRVQDKVNNSVSLFCPLIFNKKTTTSLCKNVKSLDLCKQKGPKGPGSLT